MLKSQIFKCFNNQKLKNLMDGKTYFKQYMNICQLILIQDITRNYIKDYFFGSCSRKLRTCI